MRRGVANSSTRHAARTEDRLKFDHFWREKVHSLKVIFAGMLILAATFLLARLWTTDKSTTGLAVAAFLIIWFVLSSLNLWIGVYKAGYSMNDELWIMSYVFAIPAVVCLSVAKLQ
jgi:hypothetical protein